MPGGSGRQRDGNIRALYGGSVSLRDLCGRRGVRTSRLGDLERRHVGLSYRDGVRDHLRASDLYLQPPQMPAVTMVLDRPCRLRAAITAPPRDRGWHAALDPGAVPLIEHTAGRGDASAASGDPRQGRTVFV